MDFAEKMARSLAALLGILAVSSTAAASGEGAPAAESVVFGRLSACVVDPGATAVFLERVLGWKATPLATSVLAAERRSGADTFVLADARGFQLELAHATSCGNDPYKYLSFVASDLDSVLRRLPVGSGPVADARNPDAATRSPVEVPSNVTGGTPIVLESVPGPSMLRQRGTGTIRADRIAIFVADLERSARFYTNVLGLQRNPQIVELNGAENARSGGLKATFIDANGVWLALVQPVGPGPLMDYLNDHGDGHIAELILEVDDLGAFYDRMSAMGISLVDTRGEPVDPNEKAHVLWPYGDRIAYLPSASAGGLVIELVQRGPTETSLMERRDRAAKIMRATR